MKQTVHRVHNEKYPANPYENQNSEVVPLSVPRAFPLNKPGKSFPDTNRPFVISVGPWFGPVEERNSGKPDVRVQNVDE